VRQVAAVAETPPVVTSGDAADDPAIWVHPQDPSKSLVIGTDKQRGLHVYDLDGRLLQTLPDGRMNNVDLRDGFVVDGRETALVAASNRTNRTIALYLLDPETRRLTRANALIPTGLVEPYGLCMYASPAGDHHVFVNNAGDGRFRQWHIRADGSRIVAERLREFVVGSQAEGCVADDDSGALYVAEEDGGFWKYRVGADGGDDRQEIDRVGGKSGLVGDLEGVSIWHGRDGRGYVVLSNQGANNYAVYRREGDNAFVGLFQLVDDAERGIDGVSETDGLTVTSRFLGQQYPQGLLVVQDGSNLPSGQHQNFKFVSWRDIARALGIADDG
jgi:3-phytase